MRRSFSIKVWMVVIFLSHYGVLFGHFSYILHHNVALSQQGCCLQSGINNVCLLVLNYDGYALSAIFAVFINAFVEIMWKYFFMHIIIVNAHQTQYYLTRRTMIRSLNESGKTINVCHSPRQCIGQTFRSFLSWQLVIKTD
jgi:hypothetical protein